ncbi:MAG: hypothetical protein INF97_04255 [Roseomonas sp.]|nr:hypothetical protein [Roseomonas sp.]
MRNNGPGHAAGLSFAIMLKLNRAEALAGSPPHAKIRRNGRFIAMSISISRRTLAVLGFASSLPKAVAAQAA